MERLANVFSSLTTNGYMTPEAQEDMDHVSEKMGLPKGRKAAEPLNYDLDDHRDSEGNDLE
jgi:hypothetical protein